MMPVLRVTLPGPVPTCEPMDLTLLIKNAVNGCNVQDTLLRYFLQPCARANADKSETVRSVWTSIQDPYLKDQIYNFVISHLHPTF